MYRHEVAEMSLYISRCLHDVVFKPVGDMHGVHNSIYDCFQLPIHVCTYSLMYFNFFEIFEIGKKGDLVNTIVNSNANAKNQLIVMHIFGDIHVLRSQTLI